MEAILLVLVIGSIVGGMLTPEKYRKGALLLFILTFFVSIAILSWMMWGPRDYLLWSESPLYQNIFHPYILVLLSLPLILISTGMILGLIGRWTCEKIETCRTR